MIIIIIINPQKETIKVKTCIKQQQKNKLCGGGNILESLIYNLELKQTKHLKTHCIGPVSAAVLHMTKGGFRRSYFGL